jgi:hypothetical protein
MQVMRLWMAAAGLAFALTTSAGGASAATQCKDASGKFAPCPATAAATTAAAHCKDAAGKFVKCASAGKPIKAAATTTALPTTVRSKPAPPKLTTAGPTAAQPKAQAAATAAVPTAARASLPTFSRAGAPAGATAHCKDGTYSMSKTHSGSCSGHGGVAAWLQP